MQFKLFHCWDCGAQVLNKTATSIDTLPAYRHVRFRLSDGAYCESPFCRACAAKPWPPERLEEFETAVNRVRKDPIQVASYEGFRVLNEQVAGVMGS